MSIAVQVDRIDLRHIHVDVVASGESTVWDQLMCEHHYLGSPGLVGERIRQVAVDAAGRWLALIGWSSAAFKCQARDRWIGWLPSQQWRRLPLVANNSRFLILPWARQAHLASRVLGLAVRRLDGDFRRRYGHGIVVAETFVDGSRFRGTCYLAAGWTEIGATVGYGRVSGRYVAHGQPKRVFLKPLHPMAQTLLSGAAAPTAYLPRETYMDPLALRLTGIGSLKEALGEIEDPRNRQGQSHKDFAGILTVLAMATLAGMKSFQAMADYAEQLPSDILRSCGFAKDRRGRQRAPSEPTLRRAATKVSAERIDQVTSEWLRGQCDWHNDEAIAIDGKTLRGSHLGGTNQVQLVAACTHTTGVVLAQAQIETTAGELPVGIELLDSISDDLLRGRMITYDALHTQHEHAKAILKKTPTSF